MRQAIVGIGRVDAVWTVQAGSPAQCIVAKAEVPRQRTRQIRQPVQRVVNVGVGAAVRRLHRRPVGRFIVNVHRRVRLPRQKRVLRRRAQQPPHVVIGDGVASGRIVHLIHPARQIVKVIRARRIRIRLRRQPVQRIVNGIGLLEPILNSVPNAVP